MCMLRSLKLIFFKVKKAGRFKALSVSYVKVEYSLSVLSMFLLCVRCKIDSIVNWSELLLKFLNNQILKY